MSLLNFLVSWGGTHATILTLDKQDPEMWAKKLAQVVNDGLDQEVGEKRSELIQDKLEPWLLRFFAAFLKELRKQ